MPLGDAIAYAEFVVSLTLVVTDIAIGAELCGGPIDVAVITRADGFSWFRTEESSLRRDIQRDMEVEIKSESGGSTSVARNDLTPDSQELFANTIPEFVPEYAQIEGGGDVRSDESDLKPGRTSSALSASNKRLTGFRAVGSAATRVC